MPETITAIAEERPYAPSWIDRFNDRVRDLPVPAWMFYVIFGLALIAVQLLFLWLEGGLGEMGLMPVVIFNSLFTPFLLGLISLLDRQAVAALQSMRSVLAMAEPELRRYRYLLAHMPRRGAWAAGLGVVIFTILLEQLGTTPVRYAALQQLPLFTFVFQIIDKSSAFLFGIFFYHTFRQLRLVNTIHGHHIRIHLFNLRPLQAFSRVTASTAAGLVVGVYGWMLINPELLSDPWIFGFLLMSTIMAVAVFVWPLYGVHRRMEAAKDKALKEIDLRFEAVFDKFNRGFQEDDFSAVESLQGVIASLDIQHNRIKAIPTWPWSPETAQFAITTIGLPLVLAIIRFFIEQYLL